MSGQDVEPITETDLPTHSQSVWQEGQAPPPAVAQFDQEPPPKTWTLRTILAVGVAVSLVILTLGVVIGVLTNHDPSDALVVVLGVVFGVAIGAVATGLLLEE